MFEVCISITTTILSGMLLFLFKENIKLKKAQKKEKEQKIQEEREKQKDRDELLLGVARVLLTDLMMKSLERGYTTQTEYEIIEELYKPYIKNGGNGVVKHLFEDRYKSLKVKQ